MSVLHTGHVKEFCFVDIRPRYRTLLYRNLTLFLSRVLFCPILRTLSYNSIQVCLPLTMISGSFAVYRAVIVCNNDVIFRGIHYIQSGVFNENSPGI